MAEFAALAGAVTGLLGVISSAKSTTTALEGDLSVLEQQATYLRDLLMDPAIMSGLSAKDHEHLDAVTRALRIATVVTTKDHVNILEKRLNFAFFIISNSSQNNSSRIITAAVNDMRERIENIKSHLIQAARDNNGTVYVVSHGSRVGIFRKWETVKESVIGFSGAKFQKVKPSDVADLQALINTMLSYDVPLDYMD